MMIMKGYFMPLQSYSRTVKPANNYFRVGNRVFLITRKYKQRSIAMLEGIGFDGLFVTLPLDSVVFDDLACAA